MIERKSYKPGIYTITNDEYHSSAGISRSGIMEFKRSPKHFWHKYINNVYKDESKSKALEFGSLLHPLILESERFEKEYVIKPEKRPNLPEVPLLKDVGREIYDKAKAAYEAERIKRKKEDESFYYFALGKNVVEKTDFEKAKLMRDSLFAHEQARELIIGAQYEKSIYWVDSDTGLLCKCRPDILHPHFAVDLKTSKDASPRAFQRDFYSYGYPLQLAMIHEGVKATTGTSITAFIDLVIEKDEPYVPAVYPIDEAALQFGLEEFRYYLRAMKECFTKNEWPGYKTQTITIPSYATIGD
jgi:exodeoxyribonuclease VIII